MKLKTVPYLRTLKKQYSLVIKIPPITHLLSHKNFINNQYDTTLCYYAKTDHKSPIFNFFGITFLFLHLTTTHSYRNPSRNNIDHMKRVQYDPNLSSYAKSYQQVFICNFFWDQFPLSTPHNNKFLQKPITRQHWAYETSSKTTPPHFHSLLENYFLYLFQPSLQIEKKEQQQRLN